jgi:hypothetical protein
MQCVRFGHFGPTKHFDMRSAYGSGLLSLPNLTGGWSWVEKYHPSIPWAMWHVAWNLPKDYQGVPAFAAPGSQGRFPMEGEGWYWSPLVRQAWKHLPKGTFRVLGGWVLEAGDQPGPFGYVRELYSRRAALPAGHPGGGLLKLLIAATWGKLAQGPDAFGGTRKRANPIWAGMVTSQVDAALYGAMAAHPREAISCHVDGLFAGPGLKLPVGNELGAWEAEEFDEVLLIASGRYWARKGDQWKLALQGEGLGMPADLALLAWNLDGPEAVATLNGQALHTLGMCADNGRWENLGQFLPAKSTLRFKPGPGRIEQETQEVYRYWR